MIETKLPRHPRSPVTFVIILSLAGCALLSQVPGFFASTRHQLSLPSVLPDDIQLINADTKPTLRIPVAPAPQPAASAPAPPAIVVTAPAGASANGVVDVDASSVTIRVVAMDSTGLPTVTINGMPAALRPSSSQAVEFWSDPIALKPGDNFIHISASSVAHVATKLGFTVRCTPKAAPANPNALTKAEIISLLVGAVPASRVAEIVTSRGIKFTPNTDDLDEIRAAGGTDDLLDAIQRTAPH